jgi:hypothetical protein
MFKIAKIILIIAIIGGWVLSAHSEIATFKSSLLWRGDGKGDYFLPALSSGVYESKENILTDGIINTITATWKFEGEVTLEVSADGGIHYTSVVWGVPQTSGFGKGNKIRWRAHLKKKSKLSEVKITYTDNYGTTATFGNPLLSGFTFRKPIYIKGVDSGELFNYQLNIKVGESEGAKDYDLHCGGKVKNDFADIRFTAQDSETVLPFYREYIEGEKPNRVASFWVKIPQLPEEGITVYVYYGNASSQDISSGERVFDFFDDFRGKKLNEEKWEINAERKGDYSVDNSQLILRGAEVVSREFKFKEGIIEYSAFSPEGKEISLIIKKGEELFEDDTTQIVHSSTYQGGEHCIAIGGVVYVNQPLPISAGVKYNYRVTVHRDRIIFDRYNINFKQKQAHTVLEDVKGITEGYIGLKSARGDKERVFYDWVRVRKYVPLVPQVSGQNQDEQRVDLALFKNTTLAPNGDLTLVERAKMGSYVSPRIFTSFPVRVIVPTWKFSAGSGKVSLDISTAGSMTYRINCVNASYYYASRKDFYPDNILLYRLRLSRQEEDSLSPHLKEVAIDYRPGKITVISPNGGEKLIKRSQREILWTAIDYEPSYLMNISYSIDGGKTYTTIIDYTENNGRFLWNIPAAISDKVKIKISDTRDRNIYDISDLPFSIN